MGEEANTLQGQHFLAGYSFPLRIAFLVPKILKLDAPRVIHVPAEKDDHGWQQFSLFNGSLDPYTQGIEALKKSVFQTHQKNCDWKFVHHSGFRVFQGLDKDPRRHGVSKKEEIEGLCALYKAFLFQTSRSTMVLRKWDLLHFHLRLSFELLQATKNHW